MSDEQAGKLECDVKIKPGDVLRRFAKPASVDSTPDSKVTVNANIKTPASIGAVRAKLGAEQVKEFSRPNRAFMLREEKSRPALTDTVEQKPLLSETPRRKSENVTKSRPLTVGNNFSANPSLSTPASARRSDTGCRRIVCTPDWFTSLSKENTQKVNLKRQSDEALYNCFFDCDNEMSVQSNCVTVAVRVRPFVQREMESPDVKNVVSMIDNETVVTTEKGDIHRFTYDYSFWSLDQTTGNFKSQLDVYSALGKPLLTKVLEGYNACLFAYGQTGSGKSYSMMGPANDVGIIPQFCEELISKAGCHEKDYMKTAVEVSFFEIYNEKIHDLLTSPSSVKDSGSVKRPNLKVREHPVTGPYVEGLSSYVVSSWDDIKTWLNVGNKRRATAATGMNDTSSRSHSVFSLLLTKTTTEMVEGETHDHSAMSRVSLVDLAGSERQLMAKTTGDRLREGLSINKSLHMLGKVISLLAEQSSVPANKRKKLFIPYRDSVLTWLLKESLGGNSQTTMLATISPSNVHIEETLSTLRYAKQTRTIINVAKINEDATARLIRGLREQIDMLKQHTGASASGDKILASRREIAALKEQLLLKESEMAEMKRAWSEKQQKSEEQKFEQSRRLEREGIAITQGSCTRPKLINLAENPQLTETLEYELRDGLSHVGRWKEDAVQEIQLRGPLISDNHCVFECSGSKVQLKVLSDDSQTFVNGVQVVQPIALHHGDRVIIGDHYFRFCNPLEVSKAGTSSQQLRDFEFARQELAAKQNSRLEAQLEQERISHEQELSSLRQKHIKVELDMGEVLAETLETVESQRQHYQQKLMELEDLLNEARSKAAESEMNSNEKAVLVHQLETEKQRLLSELSVVRRNLVTKHETVIDDDNLSSKTNGFLEKMERMRDMLDEEVEQQKRSLHSGSSNNYHQQLLMIREANNISEHLKQHTRFTREFLLVGDEMETVVRVSRTSPNISTVWSLAKFERQLDTLRQIYSDPESYSQAYIDDIFYDPNDAWSQDFAGSSSKSLCSDRVKSLRRQSTISSAAQNPNFDVSLFSQSILEDLADINVSTVHQQADTDNGLDAIFDTLQVLLRRSVNSLKGLEPSEENSFCNRVLICCHYIETALHGLQNWFGHDSSSNSTSAVKSTRSVQTCIQLLTNFDTLSALLFAWSTSSSKQSHDDSMTADLFQTSIATVSSIGSKLLLLVQGCSQNVQTMVFESCKAMRGNIAGLCQQFGIIALLQRASVPWLMNADDRDPNKADSAVVERFLSGCDQVLGQSLHSSLQCIEDNEMKVIDHSEGVTRSILSPTKSSLVEEWLKQMQIVMASVRLLIQKLQTLQARDDTVAVAEDGTDDKNVQSRPSYPESGYSQFVALLNAVDSYVHCISQLTLATDNVVQGRDLQSNWRTASQIMDKLCVITSFFTSDPSLPFQQKVENLLESRNECIDLAANELLMSIQQFKLFLTQQKR